MPAGNHSERARECLSDDLMGKETARRRLYTPAWDFRDLKRLVQGLQFPNDPCGTEGRHPQLFRLGMPAFGELGPTVLTEFLKATYYKNACSRCSRMRSWKLLRWK